jgi:hypothetical protein
VWAEFAARAATNAGALTWLTHLRGAPLADADTTVTPRRNDETLTVSYHSRSGVPGRGRAFLLFRVRLASLDPARDVMHLVVLETAENGGWREIPRGGSPPRRPGSGEGEGRTARPGPPASPAASRRAWYTRSRPVASGFKVLPRTTDSWT